MSASASEWSTTNASSGPAERGLSGIIVMAALATPAATSGYSNRFRQERDMGSRLQARGQQHLRHAIGSFVQVGEGGAPIAVDHGDRVRRSDGELANAVGDVELRTTRTDPSGHSHATSLARPNLHCHRPATHGRGAPGCAACAGAAIMWKK